jgi:hypothetical protein
MTLSTNDIEAFIEILRSNPELRRKVFVALAPDEFLALPAKVDRLTDELIAYRQASEERFARIEAALHKLICLVTEHENWLRRIHKGVSQVKEWHLEYHHQKHIHAYTGKVLRRVRVVEPPDIEEPLRQALSNEEVVDVFRADVMARGRLASAPDKEVYLVMEVSAVVDTADVARARRRADLMRKAGFECLAAVGGQELTEEARLEAQHSRVFCVLDGNVRGWDDAQATLTFSES